MRKLDIDEYKSIVLSILVKIDKICRENDLKYTLGYGTLIGAVRHKGFIPWDDDADIVMMRDDYDKLRKIIEEGNYGLNFICIDNESKTIYPFGKICDTNTIMYEKNFRDVPGYGAFVDVFPLDYMPDNQSERIEYCKKYRKNVILLTHSSRTGYEKSNSLLTNIKRMMAFYIGKMYSVEKLIKDMERDFRKFNNNKTNYIGVPWSRGGIAYEKDKLECIIDANFEGYTLMIPKEYDYVLNKIYGDYMKLPPEEERINKHQLQCYVK